MYINILLYTATTLLFSSTAIAESKIGKYFSVSHWSHAWHFHQDKKQAQKNSHTVSAELTQEVTHEQLNVVGDVPSWLSGSLFRNGPVNVSVDNQQNAHWFDGLAMLHLFTFSDKKIHYSNKFLQSDAYKTVFQDKSLSYDGFMTQKSAIKKIAAFFKRNKNKIINNANVNITKLANAYVALTEIPLPVCFNPETLDTTGVFTYQDTLALKNCWESAHHHYDPINKETINFLIKFGKTSKYIIYRLKDGSASREVIAEIGVKEPAYMHSFSVTQNYIILTEIPFSVKPLDLIIKNKPFIDNFMWHPERKTNFIIINRHTGLVTNKVQTDAFFMFHHVNAFEDNDTITLDAIVYDDATIIKNLTSDTYNTNTATKRALKRFTVSLFDNTIATDIITHTLIEFPTINNAYNGQPYQYAYCADVTANTSDDATHNVLYKINLTTKETVAWSERNCTAGEPIFVASEKADSEDDGVVLTVINNNETQSSFLLILNAQTFTEVARAYLPHMAPLGLHGKFYHAEC